MNTLKLWFLARLPREKMLVLAFVLIGAVIWLSASFDRLRRERNTLTLARGELNTQAVWLENRSAIEAAAAAAVKNLDPARTFDASFLVSQINQIAQRSGLQGYNVEPPRTQRSPQFAVHTVLFTVRRAELAALLRFNQELEAKAPYIGLEQVNLRVDRGAVGMVSADFQIASVELVRDGDAAR